VPEKEMNNNDKEFEEIKAWRHCEELRKREIGWTMTLSSLEEENEKLKEELQTFKDRWIGT
jgi:hypothetical protein